MRKITLIFPMLAVLALAACQTVQGAGRDLQTAGQTIDRASQDAESRM